MSNLCMQNSRGLRLSENYVQECYLHSSEIYMQKDCNLAWFLVPDFLDITTQQNQINEYQNIETKKRAFRTEILISNIH